MYVQEKTFTNWCNLVLETKGFQIKKFLDLEDGVCLILILEIISLGKYDYDPPSSREVSRNWKTIRKILKSENIEITETPDAVVDVTGKTRILLYIVWHIILRYQICEDLLRDKRLDVINYSRAPIKLMEWIQHMIPKCSIRNFSSDWTNGVALCHLVNSIRPGTIHINKSVDNNNREMNARLAIASAEDELGIPELISPYEIASGLTEEKGMMTYLSLFLTADKILKRNTEADSTFTERDAEADTNIDDRDIAFTY